MKTASFAVDLSDTTLDETSLYWDHAVAVEEVAATLELPLGGEAPVYVHVDAGAERLSLLFAASCEVGARRRARPERPIVLGAREKLKVWGIRHETGGVLRVQIGFRRSAGRPRSAGISGLGPPAGRAPSLESGERPNRL